MSLMFRDNILAKSNINQKLNWLVKFKLCLKEMWVSCSHPDAPRPFHKACQEDYVPQFAYINNKMPCIMKARVAHLSSALAITANIMCLHQQCRNTVSSSNSLNLCHQGWQGHGCMGIPPPSGAPAPEDHCCSRWQHTTCFIWAIRDGHLTLALLTVSTTWKMNQQKYAFIISSPPFHSHFLKISLLDRIGRSPVPLPSKHLLGVNTKCVLLTCEHSLQQELLSKLFPRLRQRISTSFQRLTPS